jgi:hypothetical protein
MASKAGWAGCDKILAKLAKVSNISYEMAIPLLDQWEKILVEGNRRKVLSALDGKGNPMPAVTYRTGRGPRRTGRPIGRTVNFGITRYAAKGRGYKGIASGDPHANGNLTTAEYQKLTGPPLAPRDEQSRVVANLETMSGRDARGFWAGKQWRGVLDKHGNKFLHYHFNGEGRNKKRDLRGIDAVEQSQAREALKAWGISIIKGKL